MRYLPLSSEDRRLMCMRIGVGTIHSLFDFCDSPEGQVHIDLPDHQSEMAVERMMSRLAQQNVSASSVPFFIGAGAYKHHIPATVDHIIQRSEFLTSYTPYQPEIAQGTLQYLFEFQTQVAELTGMELANASLYDGSTGTAEAVRMAQRLTGRRKVILSGNLHPHYGDVVETLARFSEDIDVLRLSPNVSGEDDLRDVIDDQVSCVVVQSPDFFGNIHNLKAIADLIHRHGGLLIAVFTEVISLGLLKSPGSLGADIVVGEGQSLGNPLMFGGPYVGLLATRQKFLRQMPGRLCGATQDADGRRSYVLTLVAREQHIRREKATSNICTNAGLCCLAFTIHLSLLGGIGLRRLACLNHERACTLASMLDGISGVSVLNKTFFNEFTIRLPDSLSAEHAVEQLAARGILGGVPVSRLLPKKEFDDLVLIAATEVNSHEDMMRLKVGLEEITAC
jgi:glycine dehydrogenase subunit 1